MYERILKTVKCWALDKGATVRGVPRSLFGCSASRTAYCNTHVVRRSKSRDRFSPKIHQLSTFQRSLTRPHRNRHHYCTAARGDHRRVFRVTRSLMVSKNATRTQKSSCVSFKNLFILYGQFFSLSLSLPVLKYVYTIIFFRQDNARGPGHCLFKNINDVFWLDREN